MESARGLQSMQLLYTMADDVIITMISSNQGVSGETTNNNQKQSFDFKLSLGMQNEWKKDVSVIKHTCSKMPIILW